MSSHEPRSKNVQEEVSVYQDVLLSQRKVSVWLKCQVVLTVAGCKHAACQYSARFIKQLDNLQDSFVDALLHFRVGKDFVENF